MTSEDELGKRPNQSVHLELLDPYVEALLNPIILSPDGRKIIAQMYNLPIKSTENGEQIINLGETHIFGPILAERVLMRTLRQMALTSDEKPKFKIQLSVDPNEKRYTIRAPQLENVGAETTVIVRNIAGVLRATRIEYRNPIRR